MVYRSFTVCRKLYISNTTVIKFTTQVHNSPHHTFHTTTNTFPDPPVTSILSSKHPLQYYVAFLFVFLYAAVLVTNVWLTLIDVNELLRFIFNNGCFQECQFRIVSCLFSVTLGIFLRNARCLSQTTLYLDYSVSLVRDI